MSTPSGSVPDVFEREMGFGLLEWQRMLDVALAPWAWKWQDTRAEIVLSEGSVVIDWVALPPRRIALVQLPRLKVRFAFDAAASPDVRAAFMRRFDLYMHRGGG